MKFNIDLEKLEKQKLLKLYNIILKLKNRIQK